MKKNKPFSFAHDFFKLQKQTSAKLLYVTQVSHCDIHPLALVMDTQYYEKEQEPGRPEITITEVQKEYPLPKGALILFVFLGNKGIPFTTYRQFTDKKLRNYKARIGETFNLIIKEQKPDIQEKLEV